MLTAILTSLARHPRSAPISRIHERDLPHSTVNKNLSHLSESESTTTATELLSSVSTTGWRPCHLLV